MTNFSYWLWSTSLIASLLLIGCQSFSSRESDAKTSRTSQASSRQRVTTVDVAIASAESTTNFRNYVGTTEPNRTTVLRSQLEGRLLDLSVIVGDRVSRGSIVGRLDDSLLAATIQQERAELASLESELAKEQLNVRNAEINLQEAQITLEQAKNDAERYVSLAKIGAISQQQAESFQTAAKVAEKGVLLAIEAINIARQSVITARGRVGVQKAAIAEVAQRQAFSILTAPATGIVIAKSQEPGSLVRPGEDIITIGDLSAIKVLVPISASDLNLISLEQIVEVRFDAFGDRVFAGRVSKIAPNADPNTRKITIEVTIDNSNNEIKSGLLAKVRLLQGDRDLVVIPQSAIIEEADSNYVFIVTKEDAKQRQATANKVPINIVDSFQNKVAIEKGLNSGDKYIVRSSQPLTDGDVVNLSILSH